MHETGRLVVRVLGELDAIAPLRALRPEIDTFGVVPAASLANLHLEPEAPTAVSASSALLAELPDRAVEAFVASAGPGSESRLLFTEIRQLGAAMSRPSPRGGALDRMDGAFIVLNVGVDEDPASWPGLRADADRVLRAVEPWATDGLYLSMVDDEADERRGWTRAAWPAMTAPQPLTVLPQPPFAELRTRTTGPVVVRGETAYDELVTPWNLAVPVEPAAVLAAASAQDVVEAVRFAARHGMAVTPQATGHGAMSELVGELLINTGGLDECVVHPAGWARVGAGVKWLRVVEAAAPHGLVPLSGSITDVGVVGYTTDGGLGPMARTYGLASDRVRAIEVVTGDGVLRRVTPTEHPELFFGLRGGKGALGIVTAIEFDLVHQPTFYGGSLWFDGADAATVVDRWRTWSDALPESGTTSFALFQLPEMPGVPPQLAGRLTLSVRYVWTGDAAEGRRRFAPMRGAAPVLLDDVAEKSYTAIDSVHTDPLDPTPTHEAAQVLTDFPHEAAAALLALVGSGSGSPQILVEVRQMGGATARQGTHPSAFCARPAAYSLLLVSIAGTPGAEGHAEAVLDALAPWTRGCRLPNFTFDPDQYTDAYDDLALARIRAAIRTYDPHGVITVGRAYTA